MIFTAENTLLIGSILLFVSIVVGKTGYRFGVPTLLLFLVVGMLFGSDGLGLQFHDAKDAQFIGMVALSIILFSGGMDTKFREIKPILGPGIVLSTVGVLLTALFTGLFIWWISGMSWSNIYLPITTSLGLHHVVYGFGFGVRHSPFTEDELETQPSSHAGTGERK